MARDVALSADHCSLDRYVRQLAAGPLVEERRDRPTSANAKHVAVSEEAPTVSERNEDQTGANSATDGHRTLDIREVPLPFLPAGESSAEYLARRIRDADFIILPNTSRVYAFVKRVIDIIGSIFLLMLTLPVIGLLALLIRLDSPGPAFFRQQRVTKNGRHFTFIKFRTMYADARERFPQLYSLATTDGAPEDGMDDVFYKLSDDPRNTRAGRWLRRTTLDELPNLFNVLKGDISLVGPRPDVPELVRRYRPIELSCLLTKAGMTGAAQTKGRSLLTVRERLRLDLQYVSRQSLWLDAKIMARTILVVFLGRGAF